jgi:CBS domain-containing protein
MYEFIDYRADDFMTFPVVTIDPHTTLAQAQQIFEENEFNCIPVVGDGRLVGMVTKLDLLAAFGWESREDVRSYPDVMRQEVTRVMSRDPITIAVDTPLTRVILTMAKTGFKSFPVVTGGELVGIVSREDVVRAINCAAASEAGDAFRAARRERTPRGPSLVREVSRRLGYEHRQAEGVVFAVFQELRDRLTTKEAADVAAQLPASLKRLWLDQERPDRVVRRTHKEEFIGRVRRRAALANDAEAEKTVRVVFRALQRVLGSATGKEGESWDIVSQLPKELKVLWLEAGARRVA